MYSLDLGKSKALYRFSSNTLVSVPNIRRPVSGTVAHPNDYLPLPCAFQYRLSDGIALH